MFNDRVTFWHLFRKSCKIKSKNWKNKSISNLHKNANQIFSYQQIQYKHIRVQFETDQFFYDPQKAKLIDI